MCIRDSHLAGYIYIVISTFFFFFIPLPYYLNRPRVITHRHQFSMVAEADDSNRRPGFVPRPTEVQLSDRLQCAQVNQGDFAVGLTCKSLEGRYTG